MLPTHIKTVGGLIQSFPTLYPQLRRGDNLTLPQSGKFPLWNNPGQLFLLVVDSLTHEHIIQGWLSLGGSNIPSQIHYPAILSSYCTLLLLVLHSLDLGSEIIIQCLTHLGQVCLLFFS